MNQLDFETFKILTRIDKSLEYYIEKLSEIDTECEYLSEVCTFIWESILDKIGVPENSDTFSRDYFTTLLHDLSRGESELSAEEVYDELINWNK
jgi:hypothetical protein